MELRKDKSLEKEIKNMRKSIREDGACLYAMGKEAHHYLGDISRKDWDIVQVVQEDADNYYGNWLYGYGYVDVRFPKSSLRELTKEEIDQYEGSNFGIVGSWANKLKVKDFLWRKK